MIEIKNVSKIYGDRVVVDNINLNIEKGKITSFIGPNGAGKSTLLSMISRILEKNHGEIFIEGTEIGKWDNRELAKKISILKQSNHINIRLTIRELVSFGRYPYNQGRLSKKDWEHIDRAIKYMKLEDIQDKYLDELSGGQRQRAYIAMVIAQDTEYILLDEPLNNLDMKHSVEIMKILRQLVDDLGKTVVIVLHDINFASCYSDNIVALCKGRIIRDGSTCEIMDEKVLKEVYEMEFNIQDFEDSKICIYYN
ncbi:MAG: ABC transporter ATP-binding protein [Clostridiales bacterium]|nr:ABC transporter ATP-binding protein [Clostridiales bacterium]